MGAKFERKENWPQILNNFIEEMRNTPFRWGKHDCMMFVANGIKAISQIDPATRFRGRYRSKSGADKIIKSNGGSVKKLADRTLLRFGAEKISPAEAKRGDVVLVKTPLGDALAIVIDDRVLAAGVTGLKFLPIKSAIYAWKI